MEDPLASIEKLYDDLQSDNDRMRTALEKIKTRAFDLGVKEISTIADEALKNLRTKKPRPRRPGLCNVSLTRRLAKRA